jgi:hypothetical protein
MCLGGPNHCRVGWMGSQSYYLSVDCRSLLAEVHVHLRSFCCHRIACVMFVIVWQRRVECIYYPCTHAHTHKKKKKFALVIRGLSS